MEKEDAVNILQFWLAADNFQSQLAAKKGQYDGQEAQNDAMILYDKWVVLLVVCFHNPVLINPALACVTPRTRIHFQVHLAFLDAWCRKGETCMLGKPVFWEDLRSVCLVKLSIRNEKGHAKKAFEKRFQLFFSLHKNSHSCLSHFCWRTLWVLVETVTLQYLKCWAVGGEGFVSHAFVLYFERGKRGFRYTGERETL